MASCYPTVRDGGVVPLECPRCWLSNPDSARHCHCGCDLATVAPAGEKVVRIRVGTREVVVGTAPVSTAKPSDFQTRRLRRQGNDLLVLWPTVYRRIAMIPLIPFIAFWAATVIRMLWSGTSPTTTAFDIYFWALVLGVGVALWMLPRWFERLCLWGLSRALGDGLSNLLPRRFEFDRAAGQVRVSWPSPWRKRPLSEVLAIQLIPRPCPYRVGRRGRRIGMAYELILVLDDADRPRVSLATYPDYPPNRAAAGTDAAELADFLGVAILDHVSGKETAEGGGDAGAGRTNG